MSTNTPDSVKEALKALELNNNRLLAVIHQQDKRDDIARMKELELIQAKQQVARNINRGKYSSLYNIQPR